MGNPKLKATNALAGAGVKTGIANADAAIARLAPIPAMVRVLGRLFIACPKMLVPYSSPSASPTREATKHVRCAVPAKGGTYSSAARAPNALTRLSPGKRAVLSAVTNRLFLPSNTAANITVSFGAGNRVGDGCARMPDSAKSRGSLSEERCRGAGR